MFQNLSLHFVRASPSFSRQENIWQWHIWIFLSNFFLLFFVIDLDVLFRHKKFSEGKYLLVLTKGKAGLATNICHLEVRKIWRGKIHYYILCRKFFYLVFYFYFLKQCQNSLINNDHFCVFIFMLVFEIIIFLTLI